MRWPVAAVKMEEASSAVTREKHSDDHLQVEGDADRATHALQGYREALATIPTPAKNRWATSALNMEPRSGEMTPERQTPEKLRMPQYTGNADRAHLAVQLTEKSFVATTPERQSAISRQLVAPATRQLVAPRSWAFWSPSAGSPVRQRLRKVKAASVFRSPKKGVQKQSARASHTAIVPVKREHSLVDPEQLTRQDVVVVAKPEDAIVPWIPTHKPRRAPKQSQKNEMGTVSSKDFHAVKRELAALQNQIKTLSPPTYSKRSIHRSTKKRKLDTRTPRPRMASSSAVSKREWEALRDAPELASIFAREQRSPSLCIDPSPNQRLTRSQLAAGQSSAHRSPSPSTSVSCIRKAADHPKPQRGVQAAAEQVLARTRGAPASRDKAALQPSPASSDISSKRRRLTLTNHPASNFSLVSEFHKALGVTSLQRPQLDIYDSNPKIMDSSLAHLTEEVRELQEAVARQNLHETVDSLTDILYMTHGTAAALGVDLDSCFKIAHASNMSKLCKTEERAKATVAKYEEAWVNGTSEYDTPDYYRASDGKHWIVHNKSTGEILKSIDWLSPDFLPVDIPAVSQVQTPPRTLVRQESSF